MELSDLTKNLTKSLTTAATAAIFTLAPTIADACDKKLNMCENGLKFGRDPENNCAFPVCDDAYILPLRSLYTSDKDGKIWSADGVLFNPTNEDMQVIVYATPKSTLEHEAPFNQTNDSHEIVEIKANSYTNLKHVFAKLLGENGEAMTIRIIPGDGKYIGGQSNGALPLGYNKVNHGKGGLQLGFTEAMRTTDQIYSTAGTSLHAVLTSDKRISFIFSTGSDSVEGILSYENPTLGISREEEFNLLGNSTYQFTPRDIKDVLKTQELPIGGILTYKINRGNMGIEMTVTDISGDAYAVPFLPISNSQP